MRKNNVQGCPGPVGLLNGSLSEVFCVRCGKDLGYKALFPPTVWCDDCEREQDEEDARVLGLTLEEYYKLIEDDPEDP